MGTSKAFDGVWHEGLIYKLQSLEISGLPLKCIESFLTNRFQSFLINRFQGVLLDGQLSSWSPVLAIMPQRFILGPLLFLVYIKDLSKNLSSNAKLFADDVSNVYDISLSLLQLNDDDQDFNLDILMENVIQS